MPLRGDLDAQMTWYTDAGAIYDVSDISVSYTTTTGV